MLCNSANILIGLEGDWAFDLLMFHKKGCILAMLKLRILHWHFDKKMLCWSMLSSMQIRQKE